MVIKNSVDQLLPQSFGSLLEETGTKWQQQLQEADTECLAVMQSQHQITLIASNKHHGIHCVLFHLQQCQQHLEITAFSTKTSWRCKSWLNHEDCKQLAQGEHASEHAGCSWCVGTITRMG
jgi:hypothetical protein